MQLYWIYASFRNESSPSSKHPLAQLDARQIYTSPEERRHNIINEAGDTRLCVIRDSDYTYQPQRIVCRGTGRTDKDSVKKVECPRPPTDPSTHHLLTCRGHVYETTFQPEQPVVTTLPLPVYHDLEQEVEEQRNRSSCWWIQWFWIKCVLFICVASMPTNIYFLPMKGKVLIMDKVKHVITLFIKT